MLKYAESVLTTVALGLLLLLPIGCDTASNDRYQTFSPADADRVEEQRRERAEEAAGESESETSALGEQQSPIVLAAAQAAARVARPEDASASAVEDTPEAGSASALEQSPPDEQATTDNSVATAASPVEAAAAKAASLVTGEPIIRTIKLLVPDRSFTVEGPKDALRVSYDDFDLLKVLNMEPVPANAVDHFPKWLADLDGKRVRVRGFMYPTFQETDIPGFVLARDNQICCFGRNPKIYDLVEVTLTDGETTDYIQGRPFDVVGTFHIAPEADDGELWQLYQIDDAVVVDH